MSVSSPVTEAYRPQTTADALGARLRARLFDGSFAPGETVSIRRIADIEGISVIPARDALRGLVAEGALVFRDSRTIVVPKLDGPTLDEMRYARLAVEGELAHRAFPALTGQMARLQAIDDAVTDALQRRDVAAYMTTNHRMHFAIYHAANAPILLALAETLWLRFAPSMRIVCDRLDGIVPSVDFHRAALDALDSGDQAGFRSALESDIAQGMDLLIRNTTTVGRERTAGKDQT